MLANSHADNAKRLWKQAQRDVEMRFQFYEYLAQRKPEPLATGNRPLVTELETRKI
jgi:hypothetical protein